MFCFGSAGFLLRKRGIGGRGQGNGSIRSLLNVGAFAGGNLGINGRRFVFCVIRPAGVSILSRVGVRVGIHRLVVILSTIPSVRVAYASFYRYFSAGGDCVGNEVRTRRGSGIEGVLTGSLSFLSDVRARASATERFLFVTEYGSSGSRGILRGTGEIRGVVSSRNFRMAEVGGTSVGHFLTVCFSTDVGNSLVPSCSNRRCVSRIRGRRTWGRGPGKGYSERVFYGRGYLFSFGVFASMRQGRKGKEV